MPNRRPREFFAPSSGHARRYGDLVASAVLWLLDELSWEGNARECHGGGLGLENVVTTKVFQAQDLLRRQAFRDAGGREQRVPHLIRRGSRSRTPRSMFCQASLSHPGVDIRAQPDARIDSSGAVVFVEAKRSRRSSFQPDQLAKELILAHEHGADRHPAPTGARCPRHLDRHPDQERCAASACRE